MTEQGVPPTFSVVVSDEPSGEFIVPHDVVIVPSAATDGEMLPLPVYEFDAPLTVWLNEISELVCEAVQLAV